MTALHLRTRLEQLRTIWILVDEDGSSRVALPIEREASGLERVEQGMAIEDALRSVTASIGPAGDWDIVLSSLRKGDAVERVRRNLPAHGRELDTTEYAVLEELDMAVPFGIWASPRTAAVFLIPAGE